MAHLRGSESPLAQPLRVVVSPIHNLNHLQEPIQVLVHFDQYEVVNLREHSLRPSQRIRVRTIPMQSNRLSIFLEIVPLLRLHRSID